MMAWTPECAGVCTLPILFLSDANMPNMDGYRLTQRIRQLKADAACRRRRTRWRKRNNVASESGMDSCCRSL
ncbi:hypothetical protein KCP69_11630 [Salmonella enterica subsp. enterica]|nr:hypothetical protein KCP69_11630 [Salmonella enterica subsp. enterica]